MWHELTLNGTLPAIDGVIGQRLITPWQWDVAERNGGASWLSFPNAVAWAADVVEPEQALLVIAVAANNVRALADQAKRLNAALPLKQLSQLARMASSMAALETSKLNLVDYSDAATNLPINSMPSVLAAYKKQLSSDAMTQATALSSADPLAMLDGVNAERAALNAEIGTSLPALSGGDGWVFYASSNGQTTIKQNHPGAEYTQTALLMLQGDDAVLGPLAVRLYSA
jgi:hypothetical protein